MRISETITVNAPAQAVWDLTVDLAGWPAVHPHVKHVERLDSGPVRVGSQARLSQRGLPRLVWTIEQLDSPSRFVWATRLAGVRMVGVHQIDPIARERCDLTLTLELEGPRSTLLGRLGGRSIRRSLAAEAAGFARVATAMLA